MRITTQYGSNASGASIIVAKGGGRQKTTRVDHSLNVAQNHGAAAGNLAAILDGGDALNGPTTVALWVDDGRAEFKTV